MDIYYWVVYINTYNMSNVSNIVGPSSKWEPSKTINVRATTWKRLQKYHDKYGSTFDSVITELINERESKK